MSSPRFKKDKEIIAEYESQVKGKGDWAFSPGVVLLGAAGGLVWSRLTLVHPNRDTSHKWWRESPLVYCEADIRSKQGRIPNRPGSDSLKRAMSTYKNLISKIKRLAIKFWMGLLSCSFSACESQWKRSTDFTPSQQTSLIGREWGSACVLIILLGLVLFIMSRCLTPRRKFFFSLCRGSLSLHCSFKQPVHENPPERQEGHKFRQHTCTWTRCVA